MNFDFGRRVSLQRPWQLFLALILLGVANSQAAIRFNEIYYSPETPEDGRQFIELRSTTGGIESLNNMWILEIDGDAGNVPGLQDNPGTILTAINLSGLSTGSNGLFMWRDSASIVLDNSKAPGVQGPGSTTVLALDLFPGRVDLGYEGDEDGGTKIFENDVSNFFLVENYTGSLGLDLDTGGGALKGDGTLDITPWTTVHDALSVKEDVDPGFQYAESFGGINFSGTFGADMFSWDPVENMYAFYDSGSGEGNGAYVGPFFANDGSSFYGSSDAGFQDGRTIYVSSSSEFLFATPGADNVSGVGGLYRGDTEQDGDVDAADIDFLYDNLGIVGPRFDVALNFGAANQVDVNALVQGDNGVRSEDLFFTDFGDADLDRDVDGRDFLAWQRGAGADSGWALGDFNGDDIVNQLDLQTWQNKYGFVGALAAFSSIPEPSTGLLLIGVTLLIPSRRR
ncbi:MAG: hypothetical protein SH868_03470 [Bythopirellula sp.]|nr:hypothetical protein [Bythopirellula sp.]